MSKRLSHGAPPLAPLGRHHRTGTARQALPETTRSALPRLRIRNVASDEERATPQLLRRRPRPYPRAGAVTPYNHGGSTL